MSDRIGPCWNPGVYNFWFVDEHLTKHIFFTIKSHCTFQLKLTPKQTDFFVDLKLGKARNVWRVESGTPATKRHRRIATTIHSPHGAANGSCMEVETYCIRLLHVSDESHGIGIQTNAYIENI